jgi:hypothetical protein
VLGFTALAVVPLAVAVTEVTYLAEITDSATVSNTAPVAVAIFTPLNSELAAVYESSFVAASDFSASVEAVITGADTTSAALVLDCLVDELGTAGDSTSVAASTFTAPVVESVSAVDAFLAAAVFIATVQGGATAADQVVCRFLWELIDDSQNAGWTTINDAQAPGWTTIDTAQTNPWTVIGTDN